MGGGFPGFGSPLGILGSMGAGYGDPNYSGMMQQLQNHACAQANEEALRGLQNAYQPSAAAVEAIDAFWEARRAVETARKAVFADTVDSAALFVIWLGGFAALTGLWLLFRG